nr:type B 50S ribosomal protein L31 [Pseudomonas sp. FW306-2-2C-B10A]
MSADTAFLTRSTVTSSAEIKWQDGNTYPVIDVDITSASHPFYTGKAKIVDTAGRVEKFNRRYGKK